jgi:ubiquinone/menaquinone biosynthesis C-methylase UbiE
MTDKALGHNRLDDREAVRQQYATRTNLAARISVHEQFGESRIDFVEWVLDKIPWRGDEAVLDVGCGAGTYALAVQRRTPDYIAADLSLGMLRNRTLTTMPRINLDAQQLPVATATIDILLANHMIYHLPRRDSALRGFRRVLRDVGYLLATTNSAGTMPELGELLALAGARLHPPVAPLRRPRLPFTLENGAELLNRHFRHVARHDLVDALLFPSPQPLLDYVASMRAHFESQLPAPHSWDDVATVLRAKLEAHFSSHAHFRISKRSGVFVCRG